MYSKTRIPENKIAATDIKQMSTAPAPVYQMNNGSDLLFLSKMADGFAMTNQNIAGVGTEICQATASVLAGTERQSLNVLNATERNGSDVRLAVERNGADDRSAIERNGANATFVTERNGGDTRQVVLQQASDVKTNVADSRSLIQNTIRDSTQLLAQNQMTTLGAIGDSRSLIQNSVRDSTQVVSDKAAETLASVERNASEGRATTYTQSAEGRIQASAAFANVHGEMNRIGNELEGSISETAAHAAMAAKDIQIQNLVVKADLALQASNNAANARMDTYQGTKSVQEQLCRSELEAYKLKEALAAQVTIQTNSIQHSIKNSELEAYKHKEELAKQVTAQTAALQDSLKHVELEAYKHKEQLSIQLQRAEVEALKAEARTAKALAECCCEIKEKVSARGSETDMLIKREVENKLRDDNIVARLGGSGSALAVPAGYPGAPGAYPYGFPGAFPNAFPGAFPNALPGYGGYGGDRGYGRRSRCSSPARDGRDGRDGRDARQSRASSPRSQNRRD